MTRNDYKAPLKAAIRCPIDKTARMRKALALIDELTEGHFRYLVEKDPRFTKAAYASMEVLKAAHASNDPGAPLPPTMRARFGHVMRFDR